jgi:hypothetical protein
MKYVRIVLAVTLGFVAISANATINLNTQAVARAVVFLYPADKDGEVVSTKPLGTGFLVSVPTLDGKRLYPFLVTARHIVEPQWSYCSGANPMRIYARLNLSGFDAISGQTGVGYVAIDLVRDGHQLFFVNKDAMVDAAVVRLDPQPFDSGKYTSLFLPIGLFATPDEVKAIGIGEPVASAGLVPGKSGEKRNYPFFKFGQVSNILEEPVWIGCEPGMPELRLSRAWFIAINLVPGTSGSPIFYVPPGSGGVLIGTKIDRPVLLGIQSNSIVPADLAGMTPVQYVFEIFQKLELQNGDLRPTVEDGAHTKVSGASKVSGNVQIK